MKKKSILIVEDEQISAIDLKETLISLGYRVTGIAQSGERAIDMTDKEAPDLILMDIRLSGQLSGIETVEQIQKRHFIPVIYLTAYADPKLVEKAKRTRPYGYIIKPYNERGIRTEIEIALYKAELDRKLEREYATIEQRVTDRTDDLTRINAALKKSETRYRLLFERSGEGIFIFEAGGKDRGKIIEVNNAGATMHGYLPEELLMMKITDLDVADNLTVAPARFEAILRGEWIGDEINHVRKDGSVFPIDFHAGLFELDGHNYVFSVMRDISEQKQAENKLKLESKITTTVPEGVLLIRVSDGEILYTNPKADRMFGYEDSGLVGKNISAINAHSEGRDPEEIARALFDELKRSKEWSGDIMTRRKDGTAFWCHASASSFEHPDFGSVWISVYTDITDRKRAEQALALASKKLGLMASITRHDILNQLMALNAYIELVLGGTTDPLVRDYLNKEAKISATIEHQILFTKDYQDMGMKAPEWLDVRACIYRVVASLPLKGIRIDVDIPDIKVFADQLLEKVFFNLFDNAQKYGGDGMKTIRVSFLEKKKKLILICEDDGAGISMEDKQHLFTRGFGKHTGLGLFLSREILSLTGITITETSEPGKGARFEILVPKGGYRITG